MGGTSPQRWRSSQTGFTKDPGLSSALSRRMPGCRAGGEEAEQLQKMSNTLHLDRIKAGEGWIQQEGPSLGPTWDPIPGLGNTYSTFTMAPKPPLSVRETPVLRSARLLQAALGFPVALVQLGEPASGLDKEDMVGVEEGSGGMHQATHLSLRASRPR